MRLTTKGQVTIPLHIRKKLGLTSHAEVEFVEGKGQVIVKNQKRQPDYQISYPTRSGRCANDD